MNQIRLSKVMADRGLCSRREADKMIQQGFVKVNGEVMSKLGTRVDSNVQISLLPEAVLARQHLITIILNKPPGYVSTQPEKNYTDARTLLNEENEYSPFDGFGHRSLPLRSLHAAGRLDIDSSGLLIFTQDGAITRQLIHPIHPISKEYIVRVNGKITERAIEMLKEDLFLDGKKLRQAEVFQNKSNQLRFVLREGRKRQIRRMCELVGLKVESLVRTRIGNIHLGPLPRGKWRFMSNNESF